MRNRLLLFGLLALAPAQVMPAADPPAAAEKESNPAEKPVEKTAEKPPEKPAERVVIVAPVEGGYEIDFDITETPELKDWVTGKLQPACVEWYPKIVAMLPSEGYEAPKKFPVIFRRNGRELGGMYTIMPGMNMPPNWLQYVRVDSADAAAQRVTAHGGKILNGPMEVPGGDRIAQCMDPQGAAFAVHSKSTSA